MSPFAFREKREKTLLPLALQEYGSVLRLLGQSKGATQVTSAHYKSCIHDNIRCKDTATPVARRGRCALCGLINIIMHECVPCDQTSLGAVCVCWVDAGELNAE